MRKKRDYDDAVNAAFADIQSAETEKSRRVFQWYYDNLRSWGVQNGLDEAIAKGVSR